MVNGDHLNENLKTCLASIRQFQVDLPPQEVVLRHEAYRIEIELEELMREIDA